MFRIMLVAEENAEFSLLKRDLTARGFSCMSVGEKEAIGEVMEQSPALVLLEMSDSEAARNVIQEIKQRKSVPVIALAPKGKLSGIDGLIDMDDFIAMPYNVEELAIRIKRLLGDNVYTGQGELVRCGSLMIDLARCEVTVSGRLIDLTFREYELLKFLASNRGRVFTRDALLDKVWGYDYLGGDRTVDVHIRRLRSKIEDANNSFIDTVRNIGYRFRESQSL